MNINFNQDNYESFNDYKDVMIEAFGISCSTCGSDEIFYVLKDGPTPIGTLIKQAGLNLSDDQIEKLIEQPLEEWQKFDDTNSEKGIPIFVCSECWNTLSV